MKENPQFGSRDEALIAYAENLLATKQAYIFEEEESPNTELDEVLEQQVLIGKEARRLGALPSELIRIQFEECEPDRRQMLLDSFADDTESEMESMLVTGLEEMIDFYSILNDMKQEYDLNDPFEQ